MSAATNPFRTARLEALRYQPAVDLVDRALALRWSAVVGPMGTGKTTLLGELAPGFAQRGRQVLRAEVHRAEDGRIEAPPLPRPAPGDVVLVDGLDLLPVLTRTRWWWACRGAVLVVAAHRPLGLPVLHRTGTSLDTLEGLVCELAGAEAPPRAWLEDRLRAHDGNVRTVLFELYDRAGST